MNFNLPEKLKNKKITSIVGVSIVILVYAVIAFRSLVRFEADIYDSPIHNAALRAEFKTGEVSAVKFSVPAMQQEIGIGKTISVANIYYTPQAHQLQLCVKYSSGVADAPTDNRIPFTFSLTDQNGNTSDDYYFKTDQRYGSRYIRVCFENVRYDASQNGHFTLEITKTEQNANYSIPRTTTFDFTLEKGKSTRVKYDFQ